MLLYEAALKAGAGNALAKVLGRRGCAVPPLAVNSGTASISFGCTGNRIFTGLPDDELYVAIPGDKWTQVETALSETPQANATMDAHYRDRAARIGAAGGA